MLIPTSQQLEAELRRVTESCTGDMKTEWLANPLTRSLITLLEALRMRCFEEIEAGADNSVALAAQASLVSDIIGFLETEIATNEKEVRDEDGD